MPEITRKIRPPRALEVPYPLGFPVGEAHNPDLQRTVVRALLALTGRDEVPVIVNFEPSPPVAPSANLSGRKTVSPTAA